MKLAAQRFGEAVKLAPNDGEAHLWLGRALGDLNPAASVAEMEKAVKLSPRDAHAWSDLGEMRYRTAHVRAAGEAFSQAQKLNPQDPKAWMGIAKCRVDFAELEDADQALSSALGLNPEPLDRYDAYFLRGVIREGQHKPREAAEAYRTAMHVLPTDVRAEVRLGVLLAQEGKKGEALKTFDDVLAVDKHCVPAIIDRTALLVDAKRYDEAAKQLSFIKSMSKNDPLLPDVQGLWGRINAAKGTAQAGAPGAAKAAVKAGRRG